MWLQYRESAQCERLVGLEQWIPQADGETRLRCCPGKHGRWEVMDMIARTSNA